MHDFVKTSPLHGYNKCEIDVRKHHIEGSQPEWCMPSMIYSGDTPFWSDTLDIHYIHDHKHDIHFSSAGVEGGGGGREWGVEGGEC